jgi:hypothetical protein
MIEAWNPHHSEKVSMRTFGLLLAITLVTPVVVDALSRRTTAAAAGSARDWPAIRQAALDALYLKDGWIVDEL